MLCRGDQGDDPNTPPFPPDQMRSKTGGESTKGEPKVPGLPSHEKISRRNQLNSQAQMELTTGAALDACGRKRDDHDEYSSHSIPPHP